MQTTHNKRPPILRRYDLITRGTSREVANAFVMHAANSLQALSKAADERRPSLHIAPVKPNMHELLKRAGETVKSFTPVNRNPQPAA